MTRTNDLVASNMQMAQQQRPFAKVPTGANTFSRKTQSLWAGLHSILLKGPMNDKTWSLLTCK